MNEDLQPPATCFDPSKIAIIIPLYNDAANITRALHSALDQICPEGISLEIIVVDDCSTDDGFTLAEEIAGQHANVRAVRQDRNAGPSAARNRGLMETDAAWYTPLDSDDFMEPDRVAKLFAHARQYDLDIVADNLLISHIDTPHTVERTLWPGKPDGDLELTPAFFVGRCLKTEAARTELGFLHPLINRANIKHGRAPYNDALRFGEDFELYTRLLIEGARAHLIDPCGYYLVQRPVSASHVQNGDSHRKLALIGRDLLKRQNLDRPTRKALSAHVTQSEKEWAWWDMIESVKTRSLPKALAALGISAPATLHILRNLAEQVILRSAARLGMTGKRP